MSTEIILVRHAIAEVRNRARWPDDRKRPLTPHGMQRFTRAAAGLARWLPDVDLVLTSPLVRARQTAAILEDVAGWPAAQVSTRLVPHGKPPAVLALLEEQQVKRMAIVGHEPALGRLLALCLAGPASHAAFRFRKGGVALLEFAGEIRAGEAALLAFVPPRLLRRMRKR